MHHDDGDDVTAALDEIKPAQMNCHPDAIAGTIWALFHILGVNPDEVHSLKIDPDAGRITAEVWTGGAEPSPWGPPGLLRPTIEVHAWNYRTPKAIALDIVTRDAG